MWLTPPLPASLCDFLALFSTTWSPSKVIERWHLVGDLRTGWRFVLHYYCLFANPQKKKQPSHAHVVQRSHSGKCVWMHHDLSRNFINCHVWFIHTCYWSKFPTSLNLQFSFSSWRTATNKQAPLNQLTRWHTPDHREPITWCCIQMQTEGGNPCTLPGEGKQTVVCGLDFFETSWCQNKKTPTALQHMCNQHMYRWSCTVDVWSRLFICLHLKHHGGSCLCGGGRKSYRYEN